MSGFESLPPSRARIDDIIASCESYKPEEIALAGIVLTLDYKGNVIVRRGLVRREDAHDLAALQRTTVGPDPSEKDHSEGEESVPEAPATPIETDCQLSQAVTEDLSKLRTAALAVELARRPDVALAPSFTRSPAVSSMAGLLSAIVRSPSNLRRSYSHIEKFTHKSKLKINLSAVDMKDLKSVGRATPVPVRFRPPAPVSQPDPSIIAA